MTLAELRDNAEFNREFLAMVREAKKAGRSADEIAGAWKMPARYGYTEPQPARLKSTSKSCTPRFADGGTARAASGHRRVPGAVACDTLRHLRLRSSSSQAQSLDRRQSGA